MRKLTLVAALSVAVLGAGCRTIGQASFKEPVVTFRDVKINGLGLTGGSLDVVLSVYNPNGFRLDATRLTYKLMVDSTSFGEGALDSRFTVQSGDSTQVRLPLDFRYSGLGAAWDQIKNSGTVNYRVLGDFTVATPIGSFTRPYDRTGRFSSFGGVH